MTAPAKPLSSPRPSVLLQFGRFLVVGVGNTLLSFVTYTVLVLAGVPYWVAGPVGFAVGAVNGYILNRRWTFAARDTYRARACYLAVQLAGLGATTGLLWLFVSGAGTDRIAAYALTIPLVTVATFTANRAWTFAARADGRRSPSAPAAAPRP